MKRNFVGKVCLLTDGTKCASHDLYIVDSAFRQHIIKRNSKTTCTDKNRYVKAANVGSTFFLKKCTRYFPDFMDGRNGALNKMRVERVGMLECAQGDSLFRFKMDICCPGIILNTLTLVLNYESICQ